MAENDAEAQEYLKALNKRVGGLASSIHELFRTQKCSSYVKTIYVGYDIDGEMVAALYGHADHVEVALALDEQYSSELLVDASHLTWRTLPVSAIVRTVKDLKELSQLVDEACDRVRAGKHDVKRDNEYFMKSRRERRGN